MQTDMMPEALQSSVTRVQTFRSDDPGAYPVCRWLIQARTPALQTLNFVASSSIGRQQTLTWPLGDPPPIRHLITEGWQPSSDALWLAGLKELILTRLMEINTNTLQVLSACTSLERLSVQCDDFTVAEFPGAPPSITLPFVQTMDLKFGLDESAVNLIRRLLTPRCLRRSLEITAVPLRLDEFAADYCNFLSPEEIDTRYPSSASIHMESRKPDTAHLVYKTESRRVAFGLLSWEEEVDSFYDLVQEFQELLDEPPLTVTTVDPSEVNNIFLRPFSDEDVRAIRAHFKVASVDYLLALIGSHSNKPSFGPVTRNSTADWNFESLKSLEIHDADLNLSQITRLVGIRWKYLQKNSKTWLEEIDLVNCRLRGMRLGKAVKQLAAIGVTLRGIGCTRVTKLAMKPSAGSTATEAAVCDAVKVAIRHQKNEHALFSLLATDVVHSIFEIVLDLNKIHDPHFPLDHLDLYRRQLFQTRRVCTTLNNFLLSSPQYWRVINIKSPLAVISACLERSGSTTLCIYCTEAYPRPVMPTEQVPEKLQSSVTRIQTLRSDDPDAYHLCRWLVRTRTPALQTLGLLGWGLVYSQESNIEPLGDLSPIRHLTAAAWTPPSDASWLAGLQELILTHLDELGAEVFQVLSVCTSLERLRIQCSDVTAANEFPDAPTPITLPCLKTMDLKFYSHKAVMNLIRRLVTPRVLWGNLELQGVVHRLDEHAADYCNFMSSEERSSEYHDSASIRIEHRLGRYARIVYETESRRLALRLPDTTEAAVAFHDLVQESQARLKGPPLTVTTVDLGFESGVLFFQALSDQNVRTIVAQFQVWPADLLITAIEERCSTNLPGEPPASTSTDWPFGSLESLTIDAAPDLDLSRIVRLVEIRRQHPREYSKTWVKEIVLVNCRLKGIELGEAVKQLAAIGVTLRGIACSRF
ncbi:hypothetical protein FRC04_000768 [Tulasnella sp. 424]|nr:hypothetical protein FRC04_000768 [Tulasnella sp. 424]